VALNRLLRQKLKGYVYERDFGGVFYIFLRGIDSSPASTSGIFYAKPVAALIQALDELLVADEK
jgi:exodeoxyribonuclease V beta subunit